MRTAIVFVTVFVALSVAGASAETLNVTPETLAEALEKVNPGDTVLLADGIYKGGVVFTRSGKADAPIVIKGAGKEAVFEGGATCLDLEGTNWVTVEGLRFRNASVAGMKVRMGELPEAEHVTVRNCVFQDNQKWGLITSHIRHFTIEGCETFGATIEHGIYVANSGDFPVVRNNRVHHNAGNGIHVNGDPECGRDGVISNGLIEGNVIFENGPKGGAAMSIMHVQDSLFRNNLLYNNHAAGFTLFWYAGDEKTQSSRRNRIYNNTVYFTPEDGRFCLLMRKSATGNAVKNNLFAGGRRGTMYVEPSCFDGFVCDRNVIANHPGQRLLGDKDEEEAATLAAEFEKAGFKIDSADGVTMKVEDWKARGLDANSTWGVMPKFAGAAAGDFHLAPGSAGIGAGEDLGDAVPADIEGTPRPKGKPWDCGCYQSKETN